MTDSRLRRRFVLAVGAVLVAVGAGGAHAAGETLAVDRGWQGSARGASGVEARMPGVLDGPVDTLATARGRLFVGGDFSRFGRATGPLVAFTTAGVRRRAFPAVEMGGTVSDVVADGAGGWFVGGSFGSIGGVQCPNLAHVRPDGSVDRGFCPRPQGEVSSLALAGSRLYVSGHFRKIAGAAREYVAALDLPSGRATEFSVDDPQWGIGSLAVGPKAVYAVAGTYGCEFLAFDPVSGRRLPFAPNPSAFGKENCVNGFAVAGGRVYAWGSFNRIGGATRGGLAALDAVTGKAFDWQPRIAEGAHTSWVSAGVVAGTTLYVGGNFGSVNGQTRAGLAAFATDTGELLPWKPKGAPYTEALTAGQSVLYGVGGSAVFARSLSTGAAVPFPADPINGNSGTIAVAGRTVVVGGAFRSVGGSRHRGLLALDPATNTPLDWQLRVGGGIDRLAVAGATLYTAGGYGYYASSPSVTGFTAFDTRSGKKLPWRPSMKYDEGLAANRHTVYTTRFDNGNATLVALDPRTGARLASKWLGPIDLLTASDGAVFAGSYGAGEGVPVLAVAVDCTRLLATSTTPVGVQSLAAAGDSVYVGGEFRAVGTVEQAYLARLTLKGNKLELDPWRPRLPGPVRTIATNGDEVLVAGRARSGDWYAAAVDRARATVHVIGHATPERLQAAEANAIAAVGRNVYVGDNLGLHLIRR